MVRSTKANGMWRLKHAWNTIFHDFMLYAVLADHMEHGQRKKSENTSYLTEQGLGLYNAFHKKLEID